MGRLRTSTDAKGQASQYVYDDAGRKINRYVNDFLEGTWTYDGPTGVLTSVAGGDGFKRTYQTDGSLRPIRITTHVGAEDWAARDFTELYAYDGTYGRVKAIEYPSGETVRLDYDAARGFAIGETQKSALGRGDVTYRAVNAISARGMPTSTTLGNGLVDLAAYDESTGMATLIYTGQLLSTQLAQCSQAQSNPFVRCLDFKYDQFSNLDRQTKYLWSGTAGPQPNVVETYQYDDLQRLTAESRSFSGITTNGSGLSETYSYDDTGNLTSKSDFGTAYSYGSAHSPSGAGPHAVLSVTGGARAFSYTYDANGNMLSDGQRSLTYDDQDRPETITMDGIVTTTFRYTPDGDRYLQRTTNVADTTVNRTVYYVEKSYERVDWDHKVAEERTYIGKSTVIENKAGAAREVRYLHLDRLGSSDAATDASGGEILTDAHGYDAYGRPRGRDWQPSADQMHPGGEFGATTNRGFTGHEQLDETMLTHMNGRIYDYRLGRFLSVDPIIGNPADSQSINPYSYVGNNPLSGVDPTGYSEVSQKEEEPFVENRHDCFAVCRNGNPSISFSFDKAAPTNGARASTSGGAENTSPNAPTINTGTPDQTGSLAADSDRSADNRPVDNGVSIFGKTADKSDTKERAEKGEPCEGGSTMACTKLLIETKNPPELKWGTDGRLQSWKVETMYEIKTFYNSDVHPEDKSEYGRGTTDQDKKDGNVTVGFHESQHRNEMHQYLHDHEPPEPGLKIGMTRSEAATAFRDYLRTVHEYGVGLGQDTYKKTDETGSPTKSEFLRNQKGGF